MKNVLRWRVGTTVIPVLAFTSLFLSCDQGKGLVDPPTEDRSFTLAILRTDGVLGTPAVDSLVVRAGTTVPYSFEAAPGYLPVTVALDDLLVSASGSIAMTGARTLVVATARPPSGSANDSIVATKARTLETSVDPLQAMDHLLNDFGAIARANEPEQTAEALQRILELAYDTAVSEQTILATSRALGHHAFSLDDSGLHAPVTEALNKLGFDGNGVPITILFVNGINVDNASYGATTTLFREAIGWDRADREYIPHAAGSSVDMAALHIPTEGLAVDRRCHRSLASRLFGTSGLTLIRSILERCGGDLSDAAVDVARLVAGLPPGEDAGFVADNIRASLRAGRGVIVVGHSRGTLVSELAIRSVDPESKFPGNPAQCVGFVSIASPKWDPTVRAPGLRSGWIAGGDYMEDILYLLPGTKASRVPTSMTRYLDEAYRQDLRLGEHVAFDIHSGLLLHSTNHYFVHTRDLLRDSISSIAATIQRDCAPGAGSYSVSLSSSPSQGGSVGGGGSFLPNTTVQVTATPAAGFTFTRWTENGNQVSTNPTYSFTVTANRSLVAVFVSEGGGAGSLSPTTLLSPSDAAKDVSVTPTFSWSSVPGANRYWLTVATSPAVLPIDPAAASCPGCVVSGSTTSTSHTLPNAFPGTPGGGFHGSLSPGMTYYWKVLAWSTTGPQGQYSTVRSFTTAGSDSPSGPCPDPIPISGAVSAATTWSAGPVGCTHYLATASVTIRAAVTVQPGTTIAFSAGSALTVASSGSLTAVGTESRKIRFLGAQPVPGYWSGLNISSNSAANQLTHVEVAHAGGGGGGSAASVNLSGFDRLILSHSLIHQGAGVGLYVGSDARIPEFSGNSFRQHAGPGVRIPLEALSSLDNGSDYITGNGVGYIDVYANAVNDNTAHLWDLTDTRILISGSSTLWEPVTIAPGVTLEFGAGAGLTVQSSLTAVGTESRKIRFLGAQPVPGYWSGLNISSNSAANQLTHVEVAHAGGGGGANAANVNVSGFQRLTLTHSLIRESAGWGLFVASNGIIAPVPISSGGNVFRDNASGGSNVP